MTDFSFIDRCGHMAFMPLKSLTFYCLYFWLITRRFFPHEQTFLLASRALVLSCSIIGSVLCYANFTNFANKCEIPISVATVVLGTGDFFTHILPTIWIAWSKYNGQIKHNMLLKQKCLAAFIYVGVLLTWMSIFDPVQVYDMFEVPEMSKILPYFVIVSIFNTAFLLY